jgi:hypothetical protein
MKAGKPLRIITTIRGELNGIRFRTARPWANAKIEEGQQINTELLYSSINKSMVFC